jgi:Flp pilus assembly protein TadG
MRRGGTMRRLSRLSGRFAQDRGGVSAVEFAIVLPFMLLMYVGGTELADGLSIQFKVTETARTITDLASQYPALDATTMSGILTLSSQVVAPYPASNMTMTVSQVEIPANATQGTVTWSASLNGTARTTGASIPVPNYLQNQPGTVYLMFGEVTYPYTPGLGYVITGTLDIYESNYFYPRLTTCVSYNTYTCPG